MEEESKKDNWMYVLLIIGIIIFVIFIFYLVMYFSKQDEQETCLTNNTIYLPQDARLFMYKINDNQTKIYLNMSRIDEIVGFGYDVGCS